MEVLDYKPLGEKELQDVLRVAIPGNVLLHGLYKTAKDNRTGPKNLTDFRLGLYEVEPVGDIVPYCGLEIPLADYNKILAVRTVEKKLLQGFAYMVLNRVFSWTEKPSVAEDIYDEAIAALIDAIYGYRQGNIAFMTYAYKTVNNRLIRYFNQANPMCPWTTRDCKIFRRYRKVLAQANRPMTFDEACEVMEATDKEIKILSRMLVRRISTVKPRSDDSSEMQDENILEMSCHEPPSLDPDQREALSKVLPELTEFERDVLDAMLEGGYGWQNRVATLKFDPKTQEYVPRLNPKTGKPYSRQAPKVALDSIRRKLAKHYAFVPEQEVA